MPSFPTQAIARRGEPNQVLPSMLTLLGNGNYPKQNGGPLASSLGSELHPNQVPQTCCSEESVERQHEREGAAHARSCVRASKPSRALRVHPAASSDIKDTPRLRAVSSSKRSLLSKSKQRAYLKPPDDSASDTVLRSSAFEFVKACKLVQVDMSVIECKTAQLLRISAQINATHTDGSERQVGTCSCD